MSRRMRLVVIAWPWVMAVLVCAPLLAPGFVLSYDMVWVPDISLSRPDMWGMGSALPRGVPSDAVVGLLDEVIPASLLQKAILLGVMGGAGAGMARLLRESGPLAQLAGASLFVWNPFVAERLGLGQWPLLLAYAATPWLIVAIRREVMPAIVLALAVTALSPATGLMGLFVALAVTKSRRFAIGMVGLAVNAPWIVAGVLHREAAAGDPIAAQYFAVQPEGVLGRMGAALSLGGIWNVDVVPASRTLWFAGVFAAVIWVVIVVGLIGMWRTQRELLLRLGLLGAVGVVLALSGWLVTDLVASTISSVPGGGLIRDGTRYLLLLAPLEAVCFGVGSAAVAARVQRVEWRRATAVAAIVIPLAAMPDLGWGLAGDLKPVHYPNSWAHAREVARYVPDGDILVLPFTSYRQPKWNHGRPVFDPAGRYFERTTVVNDELLVSGKAIAGEDPRARRVAAALKRKNVAKALAKEGIGLVVWESDAGPSGLTKGQLGQFDLIEHSTGLSLFATTNPKPMAIDEQDKLILGAAWLLAALTVLFAAIGAVRRFLQR